MKVNGYVRVSTEEQATQGISLQAQEAKLRQYCDLYGLDLAAGRVHLVHRHLGLVGHRDLLKVFNYPTEVSVIRVEPDPSVGLFFFQGIAGPLSQKGIYSL